MELAWRLDREMSRRLVLHETGFTRKGFLLPTCTLSTRYFLFVSELI